MLGALRARAVPILLVLVVTASIAAATLGRSRARARAELVDARAELAGALVVADQVREQLVAELAACSAERDARAEERRAERLADAELLDAILGAPAVSGPQASEELEVGARVPPSPAGAALEELRRTFREAR